MIKTPPLRYISYVITVIVHFKVAGKGARAKMWIKVELEPKINNFDSATQIIYLAYAMVV